MPDNMSNYLESGLLDFIFRTGTFSKPTTWLALTSTVPVETDTGATITEIAHGNGYTRIAVTGSNMWSQVYQEGGSGSITNLQVIQFAQNVGTDWGWVSGIAIMDGSGDAQHNMLYYGNLATAKLVSNLDTFSIPSGSAIIRMA